MKQYGILAINPGSTSTKIAVYLDETEAMSRTIRHSAEELRPFARVTDQFGFRRDLILKVLEEEGIALDSRRGYRAAGGLVKPIASGVYEVNDALRRDLIHAPPGRARLEPGRTAGCRNRVAGSGCEGLYRRSGSSWTNWTT